MQARSRDGLAGAILFLIALAWIAGVFWAVPGSEDSTRIGPRGFPLGMGIALAFLSFLLIGSTLLGGWRQHAAASVVADSRPETRVEYWALLATFGFLIGHLLLMMWFGFVIGTVLAVGVFLPIALKQRSLRLLAGLSLGLAFGIWFVLGRLMGVYLPHSSFINLF